MARGRRAGSRGAGRGVGPAGARTLGGGRGGVGRGGARVARGAGREGAGADAAGRAGDRRHEGRPARPGGPGAARRSRTSMTCTSRPGRTARSVPAALDDGRRLAWTPLWAAQRRRTTTRTRIRSRGCMRSSTSTPARCSRSRITASRRCRRSRRTSGRAQLAAAAAGVGAGDHAAGRAGVHGRRLAGAVAEVGAAGRVLSARGARDPRRPLRRRRHRAADRAPHVDRGARDPVRRSRARAAIRKNAFDTGEVGMGYFTNSLELGCDCLGEIRYLDVTRGRRGRLACARSRTAICLHEEDDGMLWKHTDPDGHVEVRRSRRLRGRRRSSPSTTTSTATSGTSARTARSSSRRS